jgi:glycosyltransferase involved in cell wall biosynthesis
MRVCVVGPSKRFFSGPAIRTLYLANALAKKHEVSVLCFRELLPRFLFPGRRRVGIDQFKIDFLPEIEVYDGMDYNSPRTWMGAYHFLKARKPDFIIILWWSSSIIHLQLFVKVIARLVGSKIILELHEVVDPREARSLPLKIYSRIAGKIMMQGLDAYVTLSEKNRNLVSAAYSLDRGKIKVIPLTLYNHYGGLPPKEDAKKKLGISERFVILYFGLIRRYKGVPYLIDAFKKLDLDARLLIVGEVWEDRAEIERKIKRSEKITLIDRYIPDEEIPIIFSAADVVVLPYLEGSASGIIHIAMPYKKPIIVSDVGSMKECIHDYDAGFLVPPRDADAIAESIREVLEKRIEGNPPKRGMEEIAKLYDEIIRWI